jgi:transcriptional regulator with XRE-family HTH domain
VRFACPLQTGRPARELACRVGTTQSAIARVETERTAPSLDRITELVRACGFELQVSITEPDDAQLTALRRNLELTTPERFERAVAATRFVLAGRAAMAD